MSTTTILEVHLIGVQYQMFANQQHIVILMI